MTKPTLTQDALRPFTGSEHWYRHPLVRTITYTDGAQYVAEHGGAYWLLDIIAIAQRHEKAVSAEPFQVWTLNVCGNQSGIVTCEDGNGKEVYRQELDTTDFPLPRNHVLCHGQRDLAAGGILMPRPAFIELDGSCICGSTFSPAGKSSSAPRPVRNSRRSLNSSTTHDRNPSAQHQAAIASRPCSP